LTHDGEIIQTGELPSLDIPAGKSAVFDLPVSPQQGSGEYYLNLHFYQQEATPWAPAGYEVACEQIEITKPRKEREIREFSQAGAPIPRIQENTQSVTLSMDGIKAVFDPNLGQLIEFGKENNLIQRGPMLHLWRAPTDNDGIKLLSERLIESMKVLTHWKSLGLPDLQFHLKSFKVEQKTGELPTIVIQHSASGRDKWDDFTHIQRYTLLPTGKLVVGNLVKLARSIYDLPRIGINLSIKPGLEYLGWYGRGPWENYADRKTSAMVGHYESTVTGEYVPYIMPQEHGHHTDARWLILRDSNGNGIKVEGYPTFEFNVSHFTDNDLYSARHTVDLQPHPETWLSLDASMRGLGTASCGPDTLEQYRLLKSRYEFMYSLALTRGHQG
jgi:beta-galactosidase